MSDDTPKRTLFKADNDWQHNACLNWASWDVYADGYKEAADRLVGTAMENRWLLDALIYPIVFLYRHWIELRLKEIISQGGVLIQEHHEAPMKHGLTELWDEARAVVMKIWPNADYTELSLVTAAIQEFNGVDPLSITFRYGRDRKGRLTLPGDITHINVRNLKEQMDKLALYLDGAAFGIDHMLGEIG